MFFCVVESLMEFGMLHLQTFGEVGSCLVGCLEFRLLFLVSVEVVFIAMTKS